MPAAEAVFRQEFAVKGGDFAKAGVVACRIKELLKDLGLNAAAIRRAAIAAYEAEMNVIMYAWEGRIDLAVSPGEVHITVDDRGPGIVDVELAMTEGYSTATPEMRELGFGAGMGLPNIKRNSDVLHIDSRTGEGTRLKIVILTNGHGTT
jgi:anti-sigma regulatory factor (Ser/Thr protein kinase)